MAIWVLISENIITKDGEWTKVRKETGIKSRRIDMKKIIALLVAVMMFSLLDIALSVYQDRTTFSDIKIEQYERSLHK